MPMLTVVSLIPFLLLLTIQPTSDTLAHNTHHGLHRDRRFWSPLLLPKHPFPHGTEYIHQIEKSLNKLWNSMLKVTRTKKKTNVTKQLQNYIKSIAGNVNEKGFPPKQKYKGHNKTLTTIR